MFRKPAYISEIHWIRLCTLFLGVQIWPEMFYLLFFHTITFKCILYSTVMAFLWSLEPLPFGLAMWPGGNAEAAPRHFPPLPFPCRPEQPKRRHSRCIANAKNAGKIRNANAVDAGALMSRSSVVVRRRCCLSFDDAHAQRWPSAKTCGHGKRRRLRGIDISCWKALRRQPARARMRSK